LAISASIPLVQPQRYIGVAEGSDGSEWFAMTMFSESLRAFLKPIASYLEDDSITEIMINSPEEVWIERRGQLIRTDARFSEEGLLAAARNVAQFVGRLLWEDKPQLDARLPDGSRIHIVLPPIARRGVVMSIRKFPKERLTLDGLLARKALTSPMARVIEAAIQMKLNIVVSGGTGSGKTTLLNVFSSMIPESDRVVTIEDSAELQLQHKHLVPLETRPPDKSGRGGIDMGDLLLSALRLRPDRIVIGEIRGAECFHFIQALNTGHGGSMSSCHANTPVDTLRRIESLALMSAVNLPLAAVRSQIASAIDIILSCARFPGGARKVTAISEVLPLDDAGEYRVQDLFVFAPVHRERDGSLVGYHAPTGVLPEMAEQARAFGFADLSDEFFDPATYDLPPPAAFHGARSHSVRWAPSLKHRESGSPDPDSIRAKRAGLEAKLRGEPSRGEPTPAPTRPVSAAEPAEHLLVEPLVRRIAEPAERSRTGWQGGPTGWQEDSPQHTSAAPQPAHARMSDSIEELLTGAARPRPAASRSVDIELGPQPTTSMRWNDGGGVEPKVELAPDLVAEIDQLREPLVQAAPPSKAPDEEAPPPAPKKDPA